MEAGLTAAEREVTNSVKRQRGKTVNQARNSPKSLKIKNKKLLKCT